ncbi:hypothetical protein LJR039_005398 [Pseudorhodoferax sp. LjRoot39]|uniref:hypothetical protein n=1 Tax=Pseudorhodoferax sp. LjRoot39 TaxID=3342328 RepID=UPI003ECCE1BC
MSHYWIEFSGRRILQTYVSGEDQRPMLGGTLKFVDRRYDPAQCLYIDGAVLDFGPAPSDRHVLDVEAPGWVAPALSAVEMRKHLTDLLQRTMDIAAQAIGYDDLKTAITYRGDPNPVFSAQADAFFAWRSAVWTQAYAHLAQVEAGAASFPTDAEALAMMPALDLP